MTARAGLSTERVVVAAAALADEIGFDKVTASAVARGFGVKDASLYSHVRNLQELRERIAVLAAEDLAERVGNALMGRAGLAALTAFTEAYRTFAREHPGRYQAIEVKLTPTRWAELGGRRRGADHTYALLRGYGLTESDRATDAARFLLATLHGYVNLERHGAFGAPRPMAASWPSALQALHLALTNWPPAEEEEA
ncbi:TetR family transcriptional regulator [Kitasatospora sp. MMS16-BH015]|uniref:TetR-like C-terminal domain-containing protein n=1 Tax=Kitasatospora sp. MMS16-BH015 TaxID=2018025 RepID=UPI000CA2DC63|nr:TetR-like C-terminal domain-containing protein [Kitasatospora sp. MMS16-BH015]AUG76562.1 TetR family transcriptional regulator [Kitasatospora sp. MMS16-BH015]